MLIKNLDEILIDFALVPVVEIGVSTLEVACEVFTDETPVPWFIHIVAVAFRVGEDKSVFVGILLEPLIGLGVTKSAESPCEVWGREVERGTKLVF